MIFPWQNDQWQQLIKAKQENRLPHALLFTGMAGTGKTHFCEEFVRAYCCKQTNTKACTCHDCRLIAGRAHPNVLWIEPEKAGGNIKIDQIREITDYISQTSLQNEYRIVVINPANALNINAANALLKTLEEPASGALIILLSHEASHLPATILSRCQRILFSRPPTELALAWLKPQLENKTLNAELLLRLANGAPLIALQLASNKMLSERTQLLETLFLLSQKQSDPLKFAGKIQDLELLQFFDVMLAWVTDLLRLKMGCPIKDIVNQDFVQQLTVLQAKSSVKKTMDYMNYLQHIRSEIQTGYNFNKQLMIETVLIRWMECTACF